MGDYTKRLVKSHQEKIVYLDQFVWSSFGKLRCGALSPQAAVHISREREKIWTLVDSGAIVCPISLAHVAELARWNNANARAATINEMVELSRGECLPTLVFDGVVQPSVSKSARTCRVESMLPRTDFSRFRKLSLRKRSSQGALREVLHAMVESSDTVYLAERFIDRLIESLGREHPRSVQDMPGAGDSAFMSWVKDVCRRRVSDPNQGIEPGDPFDLLHVLYAGLTDAAVIDRKHAAMVQHSKFRQHWIGHTVLELLKHLAKD